MKKIAINSTLLVLIQAVFYVGVLNMTLWRHIFKALEEGAEQSYLFLGSIPFVLTAAIFILLLPFSIKSFEKPFYILLVITSAIVNYTMYHYGTIFDPDMIENFAATNYAEGSAYFNMSAVLWIGATGVLPALLIFFTHITHYPLLKDAAQKIIALSVAVSVIGVLAVFVYKDYAAFIRNNSTLRKETVPYYYVVSTVKYIKRAHFTAPKTYEVIGADAEMMEKDKPDILVVLVGETARAQSYQLGGYERATNAYTKDIPNLTYFKNVTSCGTATAISLPCMFSMRTRKDYSGPNFKYEDNVTDIVKRAGVQSLWIDNNTGSKFVSHTIETIATDKDNKEYCNGVDCADNILIGILDEKLKTIEGKDTVIYIHLIGSHGPAYFERYPDDHRVFKPDCPRSDIQNCSDEEIRNTYDNTILFTDYVMAELIKVMQSHEDKYDLAMFYMSDHGESLGENGIYLHGMPYAIAPAEQNHVPLMTWFSNQEIVEKGLDMKCLAKKAKSEEFSHDNLSHMILGLMDIHTEDYNKALDILEPCEKRP